MSMSRDSKCRDFNELELMMNCLAEDTQWLDSFQTSVLSSTAEMSSCTEKLANKNHFDSHVGGESSSNASCISAWKESESPWCNHMQQSLRSAISEKNSIVDGMCAGKRKWDMYSDSQPECPPQHLNRHDRMCPHGHDMKFRGETKNCDLSLDPPLYFPSHISPIEPLDAAIANHLPAPEFVKLGRSAVAAETRRMFCTAMAASVAPSSGTSPPE
jgi:hypothetical protein